MAKNLRIAIQMDPMDGIDIRADSTFALALEAMERGFRLYHYLPEDLTFREGRVTARTHPMTVRAVPGNHFAFGAIEKVDLADMDVVLMRQDPPFDMAYITATHILEHIRPQTLVVNDPVHVRNAPEKLLVTHFPDLTPPSLISRNKADIEAFRADHGDIILKPLYGNGGAGVFHVKPGDENFNALLEMFQSISREPVLAQRYLPEVRDGDKRIILMDGEAVGALNRRPAEGEARSNLHVGGTAEAARLTARERQICERLGPLLREQGLVFVGIDVIGDWLTEINVTSPTGIQEISRYDGTNLAGLFWDAVEKKL